VRQVSGVSTFISVTATWISRHRLRTCNLSHAGASCVCGSGSIDLLQSYVICTYDNVAAGCACEPLVPATCQYLLQRLQVKADC
jgi:hypothetical protein